MTHDLHTLGWPACRISEALEALARASGLPLRPVQAPAPPAGLAQDTEEAQANWMEAVCGWMGLEIERATARYSEIEDLLRKGDPALIPLLGGSQLRFLALVASRAAFASVLDPELQLVRLRADTLRAALCQAVEAQHVQEVNTLLGEAGVAPRRRARALEAILAERLRSTHAGAAWLIRLSPGTSFWRQIRKARLPQRAVALAGAHTAEYLLWALSWWIVGRAALEGRLDHGWLLGWALVLLTLIPFRLLGTWLEGALALRAGALFKQRLLYGALRLEPEEVRHQGVGQLLGRVIESEAVESLALSGGLLGALAAIELIIAFCVLSVGAGGPSQATPPLVRKSAAPRPSPLPLPIEAALLPSSDPKARRT